MNIKIVDEVNADLAEEAWSLYRDAFAELNAYAVQRHLMYRSEFDAVAADRRVSKYLAFDADQLVGLATYTNVLESMPLISPAYFQRRWPTAYAEGRVWYCGFVAVAPEAQGTGPFNALVEAMFTTAAEQQGIIALDLCRHNAEARRMARVIAAKLRRLGYPRAECMDEQQFWLYAADGTP